MKRALVSCLLGLALPAMADEVLLKGGGRVRGEIVERTPDSIVLEVGPGRVALPMSRVDRIVSQDSDVALYRERAGRLAENDVRGWLDLAHWAHNHDLATLARAAFEHVLSVDPDNADAHQSLGHVRTDQGWLTAEQSYRARGLVEFEGRWVSPEERRAELQQQALEDEARRARVEADARVREAEARAREAEARARAAEAEAAAGQSAEAGGGIPYPWIVGGGPVVVGPVEGRRHGHRPPHVSPTPAPTPVATPRPPRRDAPPRPAPSPEAPRPRTGGVKARQPN